MIRRRVPHAFSIIELVVVIGVIIILAGLVLGTASYVQKKGQRSRAEAEIAAMSAAVESYKADNGIYPRDANTTDTLDARLSTDAAAYAAASLYLFTQLSGTNASQQPIAGAKTYFSFKPQMLGGGRDSSGNITTVTSVRDPFGNSYGYSTAYAAWLASGGTGAQKGYNPTFDLWSVADGAAGPDQTKWIKNW